MKTYRCKQCGGETTIISTIECQDGLEALREENAALLKKNATLQTRIDGAFSWKTAEREGHAATVALFKNEIARLEMTLADAKSKAERWAETVNLQRDELDFCKREIKRLDPRLARARWGR